MIDGYIKIFIILECFIRLEHSMTLLEYNRIYNALFHYLIDFIL
jgi:hypothetical protein